MKIGETISFLLISFLFIQASSAQNPQLLSQIQEPFSSEKVYLHTDRDFYYLGERIWFKAYLLNGQSLSPVSDLQNLYIDLIDAQGRITQEQVILCENGEARGYILIPEIGSTGTFVIRAHTDYLRNFGEALFFHKTLRISQVKNSFELEADQTVKQEKRREIDVSFFPEGGYLLAGKNNLVAFKAVDENGKSVTIHGEVLDGQGNTVSVLKTSYNGMGCFYINPKIGGYYEVEIDDYPGYGLNDIRNDAMKLQLLAQTKEKLTLEVVSNNSQQSEQKFFLACFSRGELLWYEAINSLLPLRMAIETVAMQGGINRFVLLNEALKPVSERLVFSDDIDVNNLEVKSSQKEYTTRNLVQLNILDENDNSGSSNLSVAVIDENALNANSGRQNILSYLLLDSELKGVIESPADFFIDGDSISSQVKLNLLMLTHGWSSYLINAFRETENNTNYTRTAGFQIKGKVERSKGKKTKSDGSVTLGIFEHDDINWYESKTDSTGFFSFENLFYFDTATILVQALNLKGKHLSEVFIDTTFKEEPMLSPDLVDLMKGMQDIPIQLHRQYYHSKYEPGEFSQENETILLEEVEIKAKKIEPPDGHFRLHQRADQVLEITDTDNSYLNLFQYLKGRVAGIRIYNESSLAEPLKIHMRGFSSFKGDPTPLFVIDGLPMRMDNSTIELIRSIPMFDIDKVEILKGTSAAVYGSRGANGVIAIYTKKGSATVIPEADLAKVITKKVIGYSPFREFYSPQYTPENIDSPLPDHRTTLFWDPDISTENGEAELSFFTADDLTYYRIIVEGITDNGRICLGSAKFAVTSRVE